MYRTAAERSVNFRPRRLGHVNLWVSDLEKSIRFFEDVLGIELVRRERDILIAFHSNGNTHHDIGIIETSKGRDRYGRDGQIQIPKTRGTKVGLNHLGWEMESEAELVAAYKRAVALGEAGLQRAMDHLISHSVYVSDPDGNYHEFYADDISNWRSIYHLGREDEVSGDWDPLAVTTPKEEKNYAVDPEIRRVEWAPIHSSHLTGARFATQNFSAMLQFFTQVAGLKAIKETQGPRRSAKLSGASGRVDLTLDEVAHGEVTGLKSFRLELAEAVDPEGAASRLKAMGVEASVSQATDTGNPELVVRDHDGYTMEFHRATV